MKEDRARRPRGILAGLGDREKRLIGLLAGAIAILVVLSIFSALPPQGASSASARQASALSRCSGYISSQDFYGCVFEVVNTTGNATLCTALPGYLQSRCVLNSATLTGNYSKCALIPNTDPLYQSCITRLRPSAVNYSFCTQLLYPSSISCLYNLSATYGFANLTGCATISNATYRAACADFYYFKQAQASLSALPCANVSSAPNAYSLSLMFANGSGIAAAQQQAIPLLAFNISQRDYCYIKVASLTKDQGVCSRFSGLAATYCNSTAVQGPSGTIDYNASNATAACANFSNATLCTQSFLFSRALSGDNSTPCAGLDSQMLQDACVYDVVQFYGNTPRCSAISNSILASSCYSVTSPYFKSPPSNTPG